MSHILDKNGLSKAFVLGGMLLVKKESKPIEKMFITGSRLLLKREGDNT